MAVTSETQNYFKSVRKDDNLDCINALSEGRIYIYGLADDLDVSELGG